MVTESNRMVAKKIKNLKDKSSVVKIDSSLLKKIEDYIQKEENRLRFVNKKQFIDMLVNDFLTKGGDTNGQ